MYSLSKGFCSTLLTGSFSEAAMAELRTQWPRPTVQVVDLQRFPHSTEGKAAAEPSRFYAAISDSDALLWMVVPPDTDMEEAILSYQLDVGCCVQLEDYVVLTATNGYNTVLALCLSFSSNPLSMIGSPQFSVALFRLSHRALAMPLDPAAGHANKRGDRLAGVAQQFSGLLGEEIVLRELIERPESAMQPWWVVLRIVWRGKEVGVQSKRFRGDGDGSGALRGGSGRSYESHGGGSAARVMQKCVGLDRRGDAILCVFWRNVTAGESYGAVSNAIASATVREDADVPPPVGSCVQLHRGSVLWNTGEELAPMQLQFSDRSQVRVLTELEAMALPTLPASFLGSLGEGLCSVRAVVEDAPLDSVVSITARVRYVDHGVHVNTRRGRVLRVVVSVEDVDDANAFVDITFWGDLAEQVAMQSGQVWFFSNLSVREFMRRKTLSSRSSTVTICLHDVGIGEALTDATLAVSQSQQSRTTALSQQQQGPVIPGELLEQRERPDVVKASDAASGDADAPAEVRAAQRPESVNARPTMQFVLSLSESSHTLPALVRVQEIVFPLLRQQCPQCRLKTPLAEPAAPTNDGEGRTASCLGCGSHAPPTPIFSFTLILSDGCDGVAAECLNTVGETLTEMHPSTYLGHWSAHRAQTEHQVQSSLIGTPVLAWLVREAGTGTCTAIACTFVNLSLCSQVLLTTLDNLLSLEL